VIVLLNKLYETIKLLVQRRFMSIILSLGNYLIHMLHHDSKQQNTGQYTYTQIHESIIINTQYHYIKIIYFKKQKEKNRCFYNLITKYF
jgi:hypothetical protein